VFGYIIASAVGLAVFVFILVGLANAKPRGRDPHSGRPENKPVESDAPSADEPTPDLSTTASSAQVQRAKQTTPPA
jgi:hypothetical protein